MGNKTKINRDQETNPIYKCVHQMWRINLIHEAVNAEQYYSNVSLELL